MRPFDLKHLMINTRFYKNNFVEPRASDLSQIKNVYSESQVVGKYKNNAIFP